MICAERHHYKSGRHLAEPGFNNARLRECWNHKGARMAKQDRGFASMDPEKQQEIARKGGRTAHEKGTAHEWTSEEAREAGRKGGLASRRLRNEQVVGQPTASEAPSDPVRDV